MLRRIGDALLVLGLVVGVGAIIGYQFDIIPTLPPAVLKLVLYKLIFVGGLGLLVAGAFVRRVASRDAGRSEPVVSSIGSTEESLAALPPPLPDSDFERDVLKRKRQKMPPVNIE